MSDEATFQALCQSVIEGTASKAERKRFADLLKESDSARRAYVEQMRIHAMLSWQHGRATPEISESQPQPRPRTQSQRNILAFPRSALRTWVPMAAAVILILGVATIWWQNRRVSFEVLASSGASYHVGDQLKRTSIELGNETLRFRLSSGAVVDMTGPASLKLVDPLHLTLQRGSVTVDVGTTARGLTVDTEQTRVVDLGTRFGVSANPGAPTEVAVFEGTVEVYQPKPSKDQKPDAVLLAGDAVHVTKSQSPKRVKLIALGKDANSLDAGRASDIVSNVTDNVADASFRGYYGLVRGGMGDDAGVYTTGHTRQWHPLKGQSFPKELEGADVIRTFAVDRWEADLQITLHIAHACDLYVMLDSRAPAPPWVQKDFADTGYRLRSGPWIPRGTPPDEEARLYQDDKAYYAFAVWKRRVEALGSVTLGSPLNPDSPKDKPFMYGLAVKKVP